MQVVIGGSLTRRPKTSLRCSWSRYLDNKNQKGYTIILHDRFDADFLTATLFVADPSHGRSVSN